MPETLFVFDKRNYRQCQDAYRGDKKQEYYLGDYTIEAGPMISVRADRKAVGSCSVIVLHSNTRLRFSRSWSHIREDATDVTVLWFVRRGRLRITHQCGHCVAEAGDFAITNSMTPFTIECETDSESVHEVLHVIVPTHMFRRHLTHELKTGFTVQGKPREFAIAEHILTYVFEDEDELAPHIEELLVDSAVAVVTNAVRDCEKYAMVRTSLPDKRLQDVLRYIDIHLSDPSLSTAMVAQGTGISPRYLSFLLKQSGTPFSELVWDKRLATARRWLSSSDPGKISIAEIAFRVGFKSPAHFSRMFKRVYDKGPREYRAACLARIGDSGQECYSAVASNTLQ
jgi:AraC family transcriptional regulator, positive regulator of tynA and feaB